MRPYLAIIWDSYYQAFVSWLLWIVLAAIVLVLAVFGGLTYRNELNTQLRFEDINDWRGLANRILKENKQGGPSPGKHLYDLLPGAMQAALETLARPRTEGERDRDSFFLSQSLTREFSTLMADDSFFDQASFAQVRVSEEGRDLIARGDLEPAEVARRNRILFEAAYPDFVKASSRYGVQFYYLYFFQLDKPVPMRPEQLVETVTTIVTVMLVACVSFAGIMVAIVLTSWQIPFLFEEGSIVVLLSKPISRSLLFLAKFLGGCAFTLITTSVFVTGLFVIVGLQFGIWLPNMLWSIPIFLFVFAIYYSVSAACGLMSRSPTMGTVLSIVGVFVFWGFCFGLGSTKVLMNELFIQPYRLVKLTPGRDQLFAANETGEVLRWNEQTLGWDEILVNTEANANRPPFMNRGRRGVIGPVFQAKEQELIVLPESPRQFPFMITEQSFSVGREDQDFRYERGIAAPAGVVNLAIDRDDRVLVVTRRGVQQLTQVEAPAAKPQSGWIGMLLPGSGGKNPLVLLGPDELLLRDPVSAALNRDTGDIIAFSAGSLLVLRRTAAGKYERGPELKLDGDPQPGILAAGGDTIVLGLSDGSIHTYDASTLDARSSWQPEEKNKPWLIVAAPGGEQFVVLFHNDRAWRLDRQSDELELAEIRGQGDISSVAFNDEGNLLATDHNTRVSQYDAATWQRLAEFSPPLTMVERIYYWGVLPAYRVLPKPGELDNTAYYLLTHKQTVSAGGRADDLGATEVKYDPWAPILPGAVFIVVVLAYGCWKIERMEF